MRTAQVENGASTAACTERWGVAAGFWAAANPVPTYTQYALVSNLCPECKTGDLDQELPGDGRWKISWTPVQCAVGNTPFVYSFQASSAYYIKLQISNHRCGSPPCRGF